MRYEVDTGRVEWAKERYNERKKDNPHAGVRNNLIFFKDFIKEATALDYGVDYALTLIVVNNIIRFKLWKDRAISQRANNLRVWDDTVRNDLEFPVSPDNPK